MNKDLLKFIFGVIISGLLIFDAAITVAYLIRKDSEDLKRSITLVNPKSDTYIVEIPTSEQLVRDRTGTITIFIGITE